VTINPDAPILPEKDVALIPVYDAPYNPNDYPTAGTPPQTVDPLIDWQEVDINLLPGVPAQRGPTGPAGPTGVTGATGATGSSGVVSVTSPITNSGTSTSAIIGIDLTNIASTTFVNTAIANLVNSAPSTLDTLNELATALGNDPAFATTIAASIGSKEPAITAGTIAQYLRGDKSLATFPTTVSSFTNDSGYLTSVPVATVGTSSTGTSGTVKVDGTTITISSGVISGANTYSLPTATSAALGGIKLFSDTTQTVAAATVSATTARTYGAQLNASNQLVVNVPWTDSDTTYILASGTNNGTLKLTPSSGTVQDNIAVTGLGSNAYTSTAIPAPSSTTPIVDGTAAVGTGTTYARADHVHPTDTSRAASSHTHGNITNTGTLTTAVTLGSSPKFVITDTSTNTIGTYTPTGTASSTTYLSGTGVWSTPAGGTSSSYYNNTSQFILDYSISANAQSILGGGTAGVTVAADTTYEYELFFRMGGSYGLSGAQIPSIGLTAITLTLSPVLAYNHFIDFASNTSGYATATTLTTTGLVTTTRTLTTLSTGSVYYFVKMRGVFRVTGTGTAKVYPSLSMNVTNADNGWIIPAGGVFFKATQVGNGTVSSVGVS